MKRIHKIYIVPAIFLIFSFANINAQTFGFGCLGLSGFYAGITHETYKPDGINSFVNLKILSTNSSNHFVFGEGTGYRIGANFVRAKFSGMFLTFKGYYQFLKEENNSTGAANNNNANSNYQLTMNHFGAGIDFGINLFSIVDWKIIEGNVNFYNCEFLVQDFTNNVLQNETKFTNEKVQIGYFVGTGLILHLVPDYISIEGTAGYNFYKYDNISYKDASGNVTDIANPITAGGLGMTVQINVGFPF